MPTLTSSRQGKYVRASIPDGRVSDIAIDATIRAAALSRPRGSRLPVRMEDLREKVRMGNASCLFVFVVDASGSMGVQERMAAAKGAVMSLLQRAYEKRDRVALVAFRKELAEVLLYPTRSVERAVDCLREVPTGGKTPLPAGVWKGIEVVRNELVKNDNIIPVLVLVTDGRGNVPMSNDVFADLEMCAKEIERRGLRTVIVDAEHGRPRLGLAARFARNCGARYCVLDELTSGEIGEIARREASA